MLTRPDGTWVVMVTSVTIETLWQTSWQCHPISAQMEWFTANIRVSSSRDYQSGQWDNKLFLDGTKLLWVGDLVDKEKAWRVLAGQYNAEVCSDPQPCSLCKCFLFIHIEGTQRTENLPGNNQAHASFFFALSLNYLTKLMISFTLILLIQASHV